jgi:hypothetical protein
MVDSPNSSGLTLAGTSCPKIISAVPIRAPLVIPQVRYRLPEIVSPFGCAAACDTDEHSHRISDLRVLGWIEQISEGLPRQR